MKGAAVQLQRRIKGIQRADAGVYGCKAANRQGVTIKTITLSVKGKRHNNQQLVENNYNAYSMILGGTIQILLTLPQKGFLTTNFKEQGYSKVKYYKNMMQRLGI